MILFPLVEIQDFEWLTFHLGKKLKRQKGKTEEDYE